MIRDKHERNKRAAAISCGVASLAAVAVIASLWLTPETQGTRAMIERAMDSYVATALVMSALIFGSLYRRVGQAPGWQQALGWVIGSLALVCPTLWYLGLGR